MKKTLVFIFIIIFLTSFILAQEYKIDISTAQDTFEAGENITIKVSLLDANNNPIKDNINIIVEDAEKNIRIEEIIPANEFVGIFIGNDASYGIGTIIATYNGVTESGSFTIEIRELAKFKIQGDKLIVTNIGNTRYTKTIQISIGDTTGTKNPKLDAGQSVNYRLVAPDGTYNIKVTDGKTIFEQGSIQLTGTGRVIGALDENQGQSSGLTGISPENPDQDLIDYVRGSKFVYVFVLVIFGAMVLIAIEKRYKKHIS